MEKSEFAGSITDGLAARVWWAWLWRCALWGALGGVVAGGIAGGLTGLVGRVDLSASAGGIAGWLVSIPISFVVMRSVLRKRFDTFVVRFVPRGEAAGPPGSGTS